MNWAESATKHKLGWTILSKYQSILYAALDANHAHCKHLKCMAIIKMVFPSSGACDGCTAQKNSPRALLHRWAQNSTQCTERTVHSWPNRVHRGTAPSAGWAVLDVTGSFDQKSGVISAASPPHSFTSTLTPSCIKSSLSFLLISESRWIYWGNNFVECLKKIESYVWRGGGGHKIVPDVSLRRALHDNLISNNRSFSTQHSRKLEYFILNTHILEHYLF